MFQPSFNAQDPLLFLRLLASAAVLLFFVVVVNAQSYQYEIGVGKSKITDGALKPILQGFADPGQKSTGVHDDIYARAFVVKDPSTNVKTVIVVTDNWSGTDKVKRTVISRMGRTDLTEGNFLLTATHSHAAPGGYSDWKLYEHAPGGFDKHNFECVVAGIVDAVDDAFNSMASGNIYVNEGDVANAPGDQRSSGAYNANNASERALYPDDVDATMLLLKLTQDVGGTEQTVGVINWHAVHPTNLGQDYRKVSGDNKGHAEYLLEQEFGDTIVAAFANSNAGDVSGNIKYGRPTGQSDPVVLDRMEADGQVQKDAALQLMDTATTQLAGGVDYRYSRIDMGSTAIDAVPGARTWEGGLGFSFAAGSSEDSVGRIEFGGSVMDSFDIREGITDGPNGNINAGERITEGLVIAAMALEFGVVIDEPAFVQGQLPKPLILRTGVFNPPLTPNVVPLQMIKIGDLAIVAVPGEPTTMAGRRIRQTVSDALSSVSYVAVTGYSNEYASYVTTKEEYDEQHYEGASTLFGPYTLMAYQQEYQKLALALNDSSSVSIGPSFSTPSVPNMYRVTIRNTCNSSRNVKFYNNGDWLMWASLDGTHTVPANSDYAYIASTTQTKKMKITSSGKVVKNINDGHLVTIDCNNGSKGSYIPYHQATF